MARPCTYWKTGHSYIKRYSHEHGALVGFEKSGHFFFNPPLGRGYDDGLVSALAVCSMLEHAPDKRPWRTSRPTCRRPGNHPPCRRTVRTRKNMPSSTAWSTISRQVAANGGTLAGQKVRELITVNGIRIVLEDGTWGLVRASSNKPELVVVVESPTSEENMRAIFSEIDQHLSAIPQVGEYNQKI